MNQITQVARIGIVGLLSLFVQDLVTAIWFIDLIKVLLSSVAHSGSLNLAVFYFAIPAGSRNHPFANTSATLVKRSLQH